jgi:translation initiation factor 2B subunit (eIF-2B alpha/beta/delta family)
VRAERAPLAGGGAVDDGAGRADWPPAARDVYEGLRSYRIVGASACVEAIVGALEALARSAAEGGRGDVSDVVAAAGADFCALKPSTAAYANVVRWLTEGVGDGADGADRVADRAATLRAYRERSLRRIAAEGAALVRERGSVLVHDYSSTVLAILRAAGAGGGLPVVVTAGEPIGQGARVAREVHAAGHRVTFIPDGAIARHLPHVGVVLSGVETLFGDGSLANTVGTYPIALVARELGVPVFGATECLKVHPRTERASVDELTARLLHPWPLADAGLPPGTEVATEVLDLTPAALVAGYVTEQGILAPDEVRGALERLFAAL